MWSCKICGENLDDSDLWNHMFDVHETNEVRNMVADEIPADIFDKSDIKAIGTHYEHIILRFNDNYPCEWFFVSGVDLLRIINGAKFELKNKRTRTWVKIVGDENEGD